MAPAVAESLRRAVAEYGTPSYAYDLSRLRAQYLSLRDALPDGVDVFYSLKANPSLGICETLAELGAGADVASIGELLTALAAGFRQNRLQIGGPYKTDAFRDRVAGLGDAIVSLDSVDEFYRFSATRPPNQTLLRLRPDFASKANVPAGPESRFGIALSELSEHRSALASGSVRIVGFHVHAGSQVIDASEVTQQISASTNLCLRAADLLKVEPLIFNLGGGFGVPYKTTHAPLEIRKVSDELIRVLERTRPTRLVLELGRYLVAEAGWYLTKVVGRQSWNGRPAVVVDGGTHQRADFCGLGLRKGAMYPTLLDERTGGKREVSVLGCLCAPEDVLAERVFLPDDLTVGDVLVFPNAGAYGLTASPATFLAHPLPAEIALDGDQIFLLRCRGANDAILQGQTRRGVQGTGTPSAGFHGRDPVTKAH